MVLLWFVMRHSELVSIKFVVAPPRNTPKSFSPRSARGESVEMPKKGFIPNKLRPWIEARKKYPLSHAQIQMARELGLNPKKFGSLDNTKQQPWKLPLSEFIEEIYIERGRKGVELALGSSFKDNIKRFESTFVCLSVSLL